MPVVVILSVPLFYFRAQTYSSYIFIYFSAYFIACCHSLFWADLNEANPFVCCYDISVIALSECLALYNISSSLIFKCCLLQCLECHGIDFFTKICIIMVFVFKSLSFYGFIVQELTIANVVKWKNLIYVETFLIVLFFC